MIELNRSRNNVVLSRRAVLEEERKEVREQILGRLQPGMVVEGKISNIVDFGAFVDLDGIDGLIHISELSWSHVNHPSEVLSVGDGPCRLLTTAGLIRPARGCDASLSRC